MNPNGKLRVTPEMLLGQKVKIEISEMWGPNQTPISGMMQGPKGPVLFMMGGASRLETIAAQLLAGHFKNAILPSGDVDAEVIQRGLDWAQELLAQVEARAAQAKAEAEESSGSRLPV